MSEQPKVSIFRKEHFNAAHRLHNAAWSDEKNKEIQVLNTKIANQKDGYEDENKKYGNK